MTPPTWATVGFYKSRGKSEISHGVVVENLNFFVQFGFVFSIANRLKGKELDMFKSEKITQGSVDSVKSSVTSFLEATKPAQFSVTVFYDGGSNSSSKYTALIFYK